MQRLPADSQDLFQNGVRATRPKAQGRTTCPRLHLLGSVRGDAVLPSGPGPVASRDLWRPGVGGRDAQPPRNRRRAGTLDVVLRECPPAVAALRVAVLRSARSVPRDRAEASAEVQECIALAR